VAARLAVFLAVLALVAAGCGVRNSKPFTAKGTAPCLAGKGFHGVTSRPTEVGFVAAFAAHGGLKATSPTGNTLTIAFTADPDSVQSTENAFRNHAPPAVRRHLSDIMQASRNAVILWTVTPKGSESDAVSNCLSP
jgi:hypothetical protein